MKDSRLVRQLRQGNERAFRLLYDNYHGLLYGYSLRALKSPDLAEEAVHEVFIRVWKNRTALRPDTSFKSYLFTINRNLIITRLQQAAREEAIRREIAEHLPRVHCPFEEDLIYHEYLQHAEQAIAQLPPQRRRVFTICRQQGKSYQEAAELLAISPGTVKDHIIKANKAIRHHLRMYAQISISVLPLLLKELIFYLHYQ